MATPNKNLTTADSGSGETPIIIKDSGSGETPIIIKDNDSSESPIIIKGGGPGQDASVNILLSSQGEMGWTIAEGGEVTTIIIPKTARWQVRTDQLTGKIYLERPNAVITRMRVDDMVDEANPTIDVPPVQVTKPGNDPEVEIHFSAV